MNIERKELKVLQATELEKLIEKKFGKEFSVVEDLESRNDTSHIFIVRNNQINEVAYSLLRILNWRIGYKYTGYLTAHLLDYLCYCEELEPGEYLIEISW